MAEDDPSSLAIRISRPFASEAEFLEHELDSLTRTTIFLRGAPPRPIGVVLRFEVALATTGALLRGEGRVLGYRAAAEGVDAGLTLRFTRLDARSKALVDRAAAIREARTRAALEASPRSSRMPPPPTRPPPPPPVRAPPEPHTEPSLRDNAVTDQMVAAHVPVVAPPEPSGPPAPAAPPSGLVEVAPPPPAANSRRDELLDRLRQRAKTLSPAAVESLMKKRATR